MDQETYQNIKWVAVAITAFEVFIYWFFLLLDIMVSVNDDRDIKFFSLGWAWFSIPMIISWIVVLWARTRLPKFFK